ncbi:hypothetical protein PZE06_23795 [Robertmurraya sp. DFI.2.37]|uniref:hypothetical protein n=1 Tax=Robertmurraya sp. DFI.2.37 TaxID=3031819 RepID=UPI001244B7E3|nr:hypothetical protein [Robertmurraya sp. DFI.2.37]MDF1511158.1 hypothetical protein [Robertmurraya sp. DFI.2.37]
MERLTDAELQAIKERAEMALDSGPGSSEDTRMMISARKDIPKLLAEVERLKEEHGIMVAANKRMYDDRYKYKDALETILEGDAETLSDVIRIAKAAITHDRT